MANYTGSLIQKQLPGYNTSFKNKGPSSLPLCFARSILSLAFYPDFTEFGQAFLMPRLENIYFRQPQRQLICNISGLLMIKQPLYAFSPQTINCNFCTVPVSCCRNGRRKAS